MSTSHDTPADLVATQLVELLPWLLRAIHQQMRESDSGLHLSQARLLGMCGHREWSLSELARKQGVAPATMSRMVNTLVGRGWLHRRPAQSDRRAIVVGLTPLGRSVLDESNRQMRAHFAQLLAGLDQPDLNLTAQGLDTLRGALATANGSAGV